MNNFRYYAPTKIVFGKDTEKEVGDLCIENKATNVLIHFGSGSVIKSGLLDRVCESLKKCNINFIELGGVVPNPRLSLVKEGIKVCIENNIDFILAVGGGSVIDSAKAIALGSCHDVDVWDFFVGNKKVQRCLPVGTILTISAAGSEMSSGCVISNDYENNLKKACGHELLRPKFSILNPELTYTLPNYQTSCGAVDIIMHTFERFFSNVVPLKVTNDIALSVIKNVIEATPVVLKENNNYEKRAELMWLGSISHNDLTGCGGSSDWATHDIEHTLSGHFDVAHGAGLSAIWGSWARYVVDTNIDRFNKLGNFIFGLNGNTLDSALQTITLMEDFFKSINMPVKIDELGYDLDTKLATDLANIATSNNKHTVGNFVKLNTDDIKKILLLAQK